MCAVAERAWPAFRVFTVVCFSVYLFGRTRANNLDIDHPTVFEGNAGSYFGYTVALLNSRNTTLALVSAIKDNSTSMVGVIRPGALHKCVPNTGLCYEVGIDTKGNGFRGGSSQKTYVDLKDDMDLGMSLKVQGGDDGKIVVCAPKWRNQESRVIFGTNGLCYVLNNDLSPQEQLRPLLQKNQQTKKTINPITHTVATTNHYAVGEAGFSVTFTADDELILGAPGLLDWTGNLVKYIKDEKTSTLRGFVGQDGLVRQRISQYIGYSVTSGRFTEALGNSIAASAPRDTADCRGAVYILGQQTGRAEAFILQVQMMKEGEQMGSYFGAAVLALDLTQNGFSDLLVGAPMYSLRDDGPGDEGKLYVYRSNGASLQLQDGTIMGATVAGARFASAIVHAGDLNMDGYPDVAIGAPYENGHGAVYIYNGGSDGLKTKYAQRIEARRITGAPMGFGMGISDGVDMDNNYYPDLLIGAYDSDKAYLFRAVPVVHTNAWVEIETERFASRNPNCNYRGREFICVTITPCISYDGKHVPNQIEFQYTLEMDTRKNISRRGFLEGPAELAEVTDFKVLQRGKENCFVQKAYIYPDVKDIVTPFEFKLSYGISRARRQAFCKECVAIDSGSQTVITNRTAFKLECGDNNICIADVMLTAKIAGHESGAPLVVGRDNVVTLNINVKNAEDKQAAYLTYVTVELPESADIVNLATCVLKNNNDTLECDIGNPLRAGEQVSLSIKLGVAKIKGEVKIRVTAKTDSKDSNPANNVENIALPVIYNGDVGIEGAATVSQYVYNETSDLVPVVHTFTVVKYFATPINRVNLLVRIPTRILGEKDSFLDLQSIRLEDQSRARVGGSCNFSSNFKKRSSQHEGRRASKVRRSANPAPLMSSHISKTQVKMLKLDCSEAECTAFECQVGPFTDPKKVARITIGMVINVTRIMDQVGMPDTVDVVSSAAITILDKTVFTHLVKPRPKQTEIVTSLVKEGPPAPYQLPWWAYLLIVLFGIALLLLIVFCLYKCGFFRRKEKEELEEEKRKSLAVPPSPGNSPSDDSEVRRSLLAVDVTDD
ncbi:integrin alpha-9-like [Ornithodoros turicata]|uniref:integrin alpha-9-like n=1 Tax=Ornithodoros turicata TaxID=34597 RepID=UPI003138A146